MSDIFKVNYVINNQIKKLFIFVGNHEVVERNNNYIINDNEILTDAEIRLISEDNIQVELVDSFIHGDDTILRIKEKIFKECGLNVSTSQMYLFSVLYKKLHNSNTYFKLTNDDTMDLTDARLKQFLYNILVHRYRLENKRPR